MKNLYSFLLTLGAALFANTLLSQTISTIAGNGIRGFSGDGGLATDASLSNSRGMASDRFGNIYIADYTNNKIRKVSTSDIITTIAGTGVAGNSGDGGPATLAQINSVAYVVIDSADNLYLASSNRIRKIDTAGIITTIAGGGSGLHSGDGGPATDAGLDAYGLSLDGNGNMYILGTSCICIRKINSAGIINAFAGNGTPGFSGDGGPATAAQFRQPTAIASDERGNVYVSEYMNNRIRKIDTNGIITTFAGNGGYGYLGDGIPATDAPLGGPYGVNVDRIGNVYIGDTYNDRVRKVDTTGIISTIAGIGISGFSGDGGPATDAKLFHTSAIYFDPFGRIFISDDLNHRIRVITPPNSTPYFTRGHTQNITVCTEFATVDSLLPVMDIDTGQVLTWSLVTPPAHGSAIASHTAITTGGVLIPSGSTYIPTFGYIGPDTFSVRVSDGLAADTTVVYVMDTTCPGSLDVVNSGGLEPTLSILPNPNSGQFTFLLPSTTDEDVVLTITDMLGKMVKTYKATTNKPTPINLEVLSGIYYLNAVNSKGAWSKIVVVGH